MFDPKYLCRFFKKCMGTTFLEYQNDIRISHIYQDLVSTNDKIFVILERHGTTQSSAFENAAALMPEVMECLSVSGDADYFLRIVAPDLQAFSELMMKRVLRLPGVAHIKTNIALQKVKQTHALPLDHVAQLAHPRAQLRYEGDWSVALNAARSSR